MRILFAFILLVISTAAFSQDSLSLEEAIEVALYNNYAIRIERNNNEIAENNVSYGNAGFLPVVDLTATQNKSIANGEQSREPTEIRNGKNSSFVAGGQINWTIFDGRRMFFNYDRLNEIQLQSEAELQFVIESIVFNITSTFYLAAQEEERLKSLKSSIELSEQRMGISKDKYELGRASKMEFLQAQVDLNADKSLILTQQELLAARKYELLKLMGSNDSINFNLKYDLTFPNSISLEVLLNNVEIQNPQLLSLKRANEIAILERDLLEGARLPSLSIFSGYNYSEVQRAVGFSFESNTTELAYGFTATWRIFDGFNLKRQIQNSKITIENSNLRFQEQKLEIVTQLKTAYIRFQNNMELMQLEAQNLEVARENNEIAQERYRIGLSNPLEIREAQVNLVNAEIRYQNAAFEAKRAEAELKFLSGSILENATE